MSITDLDVTTASVARVYDHWRGGKESFAADRAQAAAIEALCPPGRGPRQMTARNRAWQERAVSSAVHDGVLQVLDLGSGFPGPRPLHEAAREARRSGPDAVRVAYVDRDPVVVSHGAAAVKGVPGVTFAHADLAKPGEVMGSAEVRQVIDPSRPCLAVLGLVLHFASAADARRIVAGWAQWLPPRSRIAVTAAYWSDEGVREKVRAAYGPAPLHNHGPRQVAAILGDLDLLGAGVEVARGWGPEAVESPGPGHILAGVGRKP